MSRAVATSIKINIIEKVKSLLGEGKYLDTPSFLKAEDCIPFCCVIGSNSPTQYEVKSQGKVVEVRLPIVLDLFVEGKSQPEIDKLVEDVLISVLEDKSVGGLVNNIDINRTEVRSFDNEKKIKVLMFDLEASYYKEIPCV